MTPDQYRVLQQLYELEESNLRHNRFDVWVTPEAVAGALPTTDLLCGNAAAVRQILESLWIARKVLQVPETPAAPRQLRRVELDSFEAHSPDERNLPAEADDCRFTDGTAPPTWEEIALYDPSIPARYRSRVAEIARLLAWNYQRFNMAPATGMLRYIRRRQERPVYNVSLADLAEVLAAEIRRGHVGADSPAGTAQFQCAASVDRERLEEATRGVLGALAEYLQQSSRPPTLAEFQVRSLRATLAGLYSPVYRDRADAHVITAGVGSGKTYAFQLGALVHVVYKALAGEQRLQVLLLYPRVVLAGNQFQDLTELIALLRQRMGLTVRDPVLDAAGQLPAQMGYPPEEAGRTFRSIRDAYQGPFQILISNLDTLVNRLAHPEAFRGLCQYLDLIVLDEVHVLRGLYGAHARMLLRRLELMRALCRLRQRLTAAPLEHLLDQAVAEPRPYLVAASATVAEPARHTARLLGHHNALRITHIDVGTATPTGWVHHIFLRQRPEVGSVSAITNATACVIHNRRDGVFREYYQRSRPRPDGLLPLSLADLGNPVLPASNIQLRPTSSIHKTLGFCDSLDGVGRWAHSVGDNERTMAAAMSSSPNPARLDLPYFLRFQEPLWRVIHHMSFGADVRNWQRRLWSHYGVLCLRCKQGCKQRVDRVPAGLNQAGRTAVDRLWDFDENNEDSYLAHLGVDRQFRRAAWFQPLHEAASQPTLGNLDECGFFRTGLCWWWSMDHLGNNHPAPVAANNPLQGLKQPRAHPNRFYNFLNAVRLRSFTSASQFDAFSGQSINDLFQDSARVVFRHPGYQQDHRENCILLIGSPRIEVGIDLDRASEGITYRALRDPSSVQQKAGRVGRELQADSLVIHVVTENPRDHFYFRNPRIALDPAYLQPLPLHENNRIVGRNHFFMAIFDFCCLQGLNPADQTVPSQGDRLALINDHQGSPSFRGWDQKLAGLWRFLFGDHPRQPQNLENLRTYLRLLGAHEEEITSPEAFASLTPADAPLTRSVGALDVFRHDFGPNLLQTPIPALDGRAWQLAQFCAYPQQPPPLQPVTTLPRHQAFLEAVRALDAFRERSYLRDLLKLPVFRRGAPGARLPGNLPYLWTPTLFEAVGNESVCVNQEQMTDQGPRLHEGLAYESVSLALALLTPGTYTYRYGSSAYKVPVSRYGAQGLRNLSTRLEAVLLHVDDPAHFEAAPNCPPLQTHELPPDFPSTGHEVSVYVPRQIHLVWVPDQPRVAPNGLADGGDAMPMNQGMFALPMPPRTFPLRWYRVSCSSLLADIPCRLQREYTARGGHSLPRQPWPAVCSLFTTVQYDPALDVTDFVWGLDQQFTTRQVDPARLVYRAGGEPPTLLPIALGRHFQAPGLVFALDFRTDTPLDRFLDEVLVHEGCAVHQSLLLQVLHAFLSDYARSPVRGGAPWEEPSRPSVFMVRNLRTLLLFHLLERWHPPADHHEGPSAPPTFTLEDLRGCFMTGHPNYVDRARFQQVCQSVADVQNPASPGDRFGTLDAAWDNFAAACEAAEHVNVAFVKRTARELLLNSLGLTLHAAALRLSGAEESDLGYFYHLNTDGTALIYLFDTDDFGNGTIDVVRDTFYISGIERILHARRRALGDTPDALPTLDFVTCFEQELQECARSQAAHLAFHEFPATTTDLLDLDGARDSERHVAGRLFDFLRQRLACSSFDHSAFLQGCPEFLAFVSLYPHYTAEALIGSADFPTFQALESAAGYCLSGCVDCVVAPEQNLRGSLNAKESVNKLLLDACYRVVVCESAQPVSALSYPGTGPARTVPWPNLALVVTSALGRESGGHFVVELPTPHGSQAVTVLPSLVPAGWDRVLRPSWSPATVPAGLVRPRMSI